MLGGSKNRMESPNTEVQNTDHTSHESCGKETRNLQKYTFVSKVVNPFTRALVPPLQKDEGTFYILKIPSKLGHIPSVNTYKNVFYIP
jgi:hypothetical protein